MQVNTFAGQSVNIRGEHVGVAGISGSVSTPLVSNYVDDVGFLHSGIHLLGS